MQNWIKEGLIDWDITRDISWGVPVPIEGVNEKVFYGWFDNHLAYISSTLKFLNDNGINGKFFGMNQISTTLLARTLSIITTYSYLQCV